MKIKTAFLILPITLSNLTRVLIFASLLLLSFFVPFSLGHPQWLIGTVVNACLFLAAAFLPNKFLAPIIILPSLGVLARGIIFGPFTLFLTFFLPFIWLGNLVLVLAFKKLFSKLKYLSVFLAALLKFLFLFFVANIYFQFHLVPKLFLQTMGVFQLFTAIGGGLIFLLLFYGKYHGRSE